MKEIIGSVKNEYRKILARKKSLLLYILTGIIVLGLFVLYYTLSENLNLTVMSGAYYPIWVLGWMMKLILPLFLVMTSIDSMTGEFQDESIKNVLQLPIERHQIYLGKLLAGLIYGAGHLLIILLVSLLGATVIDGIGTFLALPQILSSYVMALFVLGLVIVLISLLSLFFKTSSTALTMSILLYLGLNGLGLYYGFLQVYLPTTYLSMYEKMLNNSMLLYMMSYYIIFSVLGIFKFQTKEV